MSAAPAAPRREEEEEGSDPVNITVTWRGLPQYRSNCLTLSVPRGEKHKQICRDLVRHFILSSWNIRWWREKYQIGIGEHLIFFIRHAYIYHSEPSNPTIHLVVRLMKSRIPLRPVCIFDILAEKSINPVALVSPSLNPIYWQNCPESSPHQHPLPSVPLCSREGILIKFPARSSWRYIGLHTSLRTIFYFLCLRQEWWNDRNLFFYNNIQKKPPRATYDLIFEFLGHSNKIPHDYVLICWDLDLTKVSCNQAGDWALLRRCRQLKLTPIVGIADWLEFPIVSWKKDF